MLVMNHNLPCTRERAIEWRREVYCNHLCRSS